MTGKKQDLQKRFWSKVEKTDGCWVWKAFKNWKGYGVFGIDGRMVGAHRVAYTMLVGPIPEGKQLDHLCRNRACVNPDHLEPVTPKENVLRGEGIAAKEAKQTHCKRGHALTPDNLVECRLRRGERECRICAKIRMNKWSGQGY